MDTLGIDVNEPEKSKNEIHAYCEVFHNSSYNQELIKKIDQVKQEPFIAPSNYSLYKATWSDQMQFLLQRSFFHYVRNVKVVITDLLMVIATAILGGLIFYQTGSNQNGICIFDQRAVANMRTLIVSLSFGHLLFIKIT